MVMMMMIMRRMMMLRIMQKDKVEHDKVEDDDVERRLMVMVMVMVMVMIMMMMVMMMMVMMMVMMMMMVRMVMMAMMMVMFMFMMMMMMLRTVMKRIILLMLRTMSWRLMLRMMRSRGRKMMMLRRMMLMRRTDPKTGPTLCASLHSGNALGHFADQDRGPHFARACAVEMRLDIAQEALYARISGKMPRAKTGDYTLCEPAQSKCTWTLHNDYHKVYTLNSLKLFQYNTIFNKIAMNST